MGKATPGAPPFAAQGSAVSETPSAPPWTCKSKKHTTYRLARADAGSDEPLPSPPDRAQNARHRTPFFPARRVVRLPNPPLPPPWGETARVMLVASPRSIHRRTSVGKILMRCDAALEEPFRDSERAPSLSPAAPAAERGCGDRRHSLFLPLRARKGAEPSANALSVSSAGFSVGRDPVVRLPSAMSNERLQAAHQHQASP